MALNNRTSNAVAYGITNALQTLAPKPIIAQRAPSTADTAPYGTIWCDQPANLVYALTSITSGLANWQLLESSGGAGVFSSLTVNPGPVTTSGTGAVNISADAAATTVNVGTGGAAKAVTLGSTNTTSGTTIQSGSGNMLLNSAGGTMTLESTNQAITVASGTGEIDISADAAATTVKVGTGGAAKTVTLGSTSSTSSTTVQSGSGALNVTSNGGTLTIDSGTGELDISTDADDTTVNIATGGAAKAVTLGSTSTTSATTIQGGSGTTSIVNNSNVAGAVTLSTAGGTTETILITNTDGTSASAINITAAAGGIAVNSDLGLVLNDSNSEVAVVPAISTTSSPTASLNSRVIRVIFTGFTTAGSGGTQAFTIGSTEILATSGIFVNVANLNASTNGAMMQLTNVTQATSSIVVNTTNVATGALGTGDDVIVTVWIIS